MAQVARRASISASVPNSPSRRPSSYASARTGCC